MISERALIDLLWLAKFNFINRKCVGNEATRPEGDINDQSYEQWEEVKKVEKALCRGEVPLVPPGEFDCTVDRADLTRYMNMRGDFK